ncbi:MAG TPA: TolC family protein [Terriglobales bacterium]|nr:TolC family protein [Terriglobales bacterium]
MCSLLLLLPQPAAAQQALDLKTALAAAQTGNLELRAARQQRAIALAGITTARQLPNPALGFTAARDTPHEGVALDLPIELGGKRSKRIALAQEEQKAIEVDIGVLERQVRRRTREAFFRSLVARAQSQQAKTALDLANRTRDIAQSRFDAGDVAQLDVFQADVEAARAAADYQLTVQAQRSADVLLAALLNRPLSDQLGLAGNAEELPPAATLETVTAQAMESNSDLLKTSQDLRSEERRLALARAQRIPNVDLSAGADFNSPPDFQAGAKGGITVTLPLLYHGQGEVAASSARLELLRLTLGFQRINASAQVAAAYYDYLAKANQAQQYSQRIVPEMVRLLEMAEESYRSGKSNLLTLIDAQRRLSDTRKSYLDTLLAAHTSFAALEETVGAPLD